MNMNEILNKVQATLELIRLPKYLRDLPRDLKDSLKVAQAELYRTDRSGPENLFQFTRRLRFEWSIDLAEAWDEAPAIIMLFDFIPIPKEILKGIINPYLKKQFRKLIEKLT